MDNTETLDQNEKKIYVQRCGVIGRKYELYDVTPYQSVAVWTVTLM